ncbi:MAG: response regulator [Elusimicrobiota bacterium]
MTKFLVVDDSEFMRLTIKNRLKKIEDNDVEEVEEAKNAKEAFEKYKEFKPDIVTMDILMPIENGLDAVKKIVDFDPEARIIMISAVGQENIVEEAMKIGAKGYVVKPIKQENLEKAVKKVKK